MYKLRAGIAGFVTLLILTPSVVLAKNYCISGFPNPSYILVGIGFTVPGKAKCKPWAGFNVEGNYPTSGMGCTSSDGSNLSLTLTSGNQVGGWVEIDVLSLSLPSQTGDEAGQVLQSSAVDSFSATGISGGACTTKTIPAVTEEGAAAARPGNR